MKLRKAAIWLVMASFLASGFCGRKAFYEPKKLSSQRPHMSAMKASQPPGIDGELDDACWRQAPSVTEFWRTEMTMPFISPFAVST